MSNTVIVWLILAGVALFTFIPIAVNNVLRQRPYEELIAAGGLVLAGCVIVGAFILADLNRKPDTPAHAGVELSRQAWSMATDWVQEQLATPATARFPFPDSRGCSVQRVDELDSWHVVGFVDAQNLFGALIRSYWEAYLRNDPGSANWRLVYLRIDDYEQGAIPVSSRATTTIPAVTEPSAIVHTATTSSTQISTTTQPEWLVRHGIEEQAARAEAERRVQVRQKYSAQFRAPVGKQVSLVTLSGRTVSGVVVSVSSNNVSLRRSGATISLSRFSLSPVARQLCFKEDYVECNASRELANEAASR